MKLKNKTKKQRPNTKNTDQKQKMIFTSLFFLCSCQRRQLKGDVLLMNDTHMKGILN